MALSGKLDEVGESDRWIWERLGHIWERSLLDRFIAAAEAFDKDLNLYLLKTFLNKVEEP